MVRIVDIQLLALRRLLADRQITLDVTDAAKEWLGDKGYDPVYGARPLKRTLQTYVQNKLAELILTGTVMDGMTVSVDAHPGGLSIIPKHQG